MKVDKKESVGGQKRGFVFWMTKEVMEILKWWWWMEKERDFGGADVEEGAKNCHVDND